MDLHEKNKPTNPKLWASFVSKAKSKFDVYPSAYANAWAAKQYKAAGGSWTKESVEHDGDILESVIDDMTSDIADKIKRELKSRTGNSSVKDYAKKAQESVEIAEQRFSKSMIDKLRKEYGTLSTIDPSQPTYKRLTALLDKLTDAQLEQLSKEKIKFVSSLALNRATKRKMKKEEIELDEANAKEYKMDAPDNIKKAIEGGKAKILKTAPSYLGGKSVFAVIENPFAKGSQHDPVVMAIISNPSRGKIKLFRYFGSHPSPTGAMKFAKNNDLLESVEEAVKVGDTVHLGHATKGGTGVKGKVHKIDGKMVHIKNDKGDIFKGPMNRVSTTESFEKLTPAQERDAERRLKPTRATVSKVRLRASDAQVAAKVKQHQDEKGGNPGNTRRRRVRDLRLRDHVELEEAHAKDIVKGLTDMDGPFTVVAIKNNKVIKQENTKMRNMLPAIVKMMRKEVGSGVTIAIEDRKGTIRNTFKEDVELKESFEFQFADKETAQKFMREISQKRLGSSTGTADGKVRTEGPSQAGVGSPTRAHQQMAKIMKKHGGKLLRTDEGPRMKKVFKEDVEQVDELKSSTLRSYLDKSRKQNQTRVTRMTDQPDHMPADKGEMHKLRKRRKGSEQAASRLDARKHNLEPRLKREEIEQVDELDTETMKSYIHKASGQVRSDLSTGKHSPKTNKRAKGVAKAKADLDMRKIAGKDYRKRMG